MRRVAGRNHRARTAFALHRFIHVGGHIVRTLLSALAITALVGAATPALADSGPGGSLQRAILAARDFGVIAFSEIQYFDGKWEIEGRDPRGKTVNMNVDAITGAVLKVNRD
jgi:hypothetical protein